jgi:methionine-rich copper-binding protein CopC
MTRQWRRRLGIVAVLAGMLVLIGGYGIAVSAHAQYKSSVPAMNATVNAAPAQVAITFSEETSPTKSGGSVTDASGATVSTGWKVDLNDRTKMTIDLKPNLPNGVYTVKWNSFTEDDNGEANGTFSFTVQGAQQAATTAPSATTPAGTTTGSPASGTTAPATTTAPTATRAATTAAVSATATPGPATTSATRAAASAVATGTGGATLPATGKSTSGDSSPWLPLVVLVAAGSIVAGFAFRYRAASRR